jgi:hypothetical protein
MNARGRLAFSTELYCLRQIIPQRFYHEHISEAIGGEKNPGRD